MKRFRWLVLVLSIAIPSVNFVSAFSLLEEKYARARFVRCVEGHDFACPLYRDLLLENPSDLTVATRIAACADAPRRMQGFFHSLIDSCKISQLRRILHDARFTSRSIGELLVKQTSGNSHMPVPSWAPYITPAAAGTVTSSPYQHSLFHSLVALFVLGVAVRKELLGDELVALLHSLRLAFPCDADSNLLVSYVCLTPVDLPEGITIIIASDWHPRVLSSVELYVNPDGTGEEAVMYVGPDSLALVQHFTLGCMPSRCTWLDLCSGSGIQALVALSAKRCQTAVLVDKSPRAIRFAYFNGLLNGLTDRIILVQGDLLENRGCIYKAGEVPQERSDHVLDRLLRDISVNGYQVVTANPPFLPVPPAIVTKRHGLFSSGGPSGMCVLEAVLRTSFSSLQLNGFVAVVSEFFFGDNDDDLLRKLENWFGSNGLLLTNQYSLDADEYSARRADTEEEYSSWKNHLAEEGIVSCSPGLFYAQRQLNTLPHTHQRVPKSALGSIWTPSNVDAVQFTRGACVEYFGAMGLSKQNFPDLVD